MKSLLAILYAAIFGAGVAAAVFTLYSVLMVIASAIKGVAQ